MNGAAEVTLVVLALVVLAVVSAGVLVGSRRVGIDQPAARRSALKVALLLGVWLAIAAALAISGVIGNWSSPPPRWPLLPLTAFVVTALFMRSPGARRVLAGIPPAWLIAAQSFRIAVECALYALYVAGRAPFKSRSKGVTSTCSSVFPRHSSLGWLPAGASAKPAS